VRVHRREDPSRTDATGAAATVADERHPLVTVVSLRDGEAGTTGGAVVTPR
jgi:hypothetical protein